MICNKCGKEIEDEQKFCPNCGKKVKSNLIDDKHKKGKKILFFTIILILTLVIVCFFSKNLNYANDLKACYLSISENYDYDKYEKIVNQHLGDDKFKADAEKELYKAIDEKIEIIKNGDSEPYDKLKELLQYRRFKDNELQKRYVVMTSYTRINTSNKYIKEGDYYSAYVFLMKADEETSDEETKKVISNKLDEIRDNAVEQVIKKGNEYIKKENYDDLEEMLETFEDLKVSNTKFKEFYTKSKNLIEEHNKKEEEKEKARKKKEGVTIGMTKQQVLDSMWGEPQKINRTATAYGVSEQWVYPNGNYLYFENGRLTAIQN